MNINNNRKTRLTQMQTTLIVIIEDPRDDDV